MEISLIIPFMNLLWFSFFHSTVFAVGSNIRTRLRRYGSEKMENKCNFPEVASIGPLFKGHLTYGTYLEVYVRVDIAEKILDELDFLIGKLKLDSDEARNKLAMPYVHCYGSTKMSLLQPKKSELAYAISNYHFSLYVTINKNLFNKILYNMYEWKTEGLCLTFDYFLYAVPGWITILKTVHTEYNEIFGALTRHTVTLVNDQNFGYEVRSMIIAPYNALANSPKKKITYKDDLRAIIRIAVESCLGLRSNEYDTQKSNDGESLVYSSEKWDSYAGYKFVIELLQTFEKQIDHAPEIPNSKIYDNFIDIFKYSDIKNQNFVMSRFKINMNAKIGKGGIGEIFEAEDIESGKKLAFKKSNHSARDEHFIGYHKLMLKGPGSLNNNLAQILPYYINTPINGYFMTLFGETLADLLSYTNPHRLRYILIIPKIMLDVINAIKYMHELGLAHGDIKADNIVRGGEKNKFQRGDSHPNIGIPKPDSYYLIDYGTVHKIGSAGSSLSNYQTLAGEDAEKGKITNRRSDLQAVAHAILDGLLAKILFRPGNTPSKAEFWKDEASIEAGINGHLSNASLNSRTTLKIASILVKYSRYVFRITRKDGNYSKMLSEIYEFLTSVRL